MPLKVEPDLRNEILTLSRVSTFRFVSAALMDWTLIGVAIAMALWARHWAVDLMAMFLIATRQHAFMILVHDATHFRAHNKLMWNDLISDILCAFPVFFDTVIYRFRHLRHHEHLNTQQDPDWVRKAPVRDWHFPKSSLGFWSMMGAYLSHKGTVEWLQATWYFSGLTGLSGLPRSKARVASKMAFWTVILSALFISGHFFTFAKFWLLPFFVIFPVLQRLRSVAEHFAISYDGELQSSRDICPPWIEKLLLAPHNVHIHLSHHLFPSVPFHNLERLHRVLLRNPEFKTKAKVNSSYLWPSAQSLMRDIHLESPPDITLLGSKAAPEQIGLSRAS